MRNQYPEREETDFGGQRCGCGDNWWYLTQEEQKGKRELLADALSRLGSVQLTESDARMARRA